VNAFLLYKYIIKSRDISFGDVVNCAQQFSGVSDKSARNSISRRLAAVKAINSGDIPDSLALELLVQNDKNLNSRLG
jgi:hypothetical protein